MYVFRLKWHWLPFLVWYKTAVWTTAAAPEPDLGDAECFAAKMVV